MANTHLKRCSTFLVIMERQIKFTMRYHYRPLEWQGENTGGKKKKTKGQRLLGCGETATLILPEDIKWCNDFRKHFGASLKS